MRARKALVSLLGDGERNPLLRAEAAQTLGALCAKEAVDALDDAARRGASPVSSPEEVTLAVSALGALAAIHPPDLTKRIEALQRGDAGPAFRASAARALATSPPRCHIRPPASR